MKMFIYFVGRFIRFFPKRVAAVLALLLVIAPIVLVVTVFWYFKPPGLVKWLVSIGMLVFQVIWSLMVGTWWDEHYPKHTGVQTFPLRR